MFVSIRRPVRGLTVRNSGLAIPFSVSIRRPVRGLTANDSLRSSAENGFNPQARAGPDVVARYLDDHSGVSIRRPVRGLTQQNINRFGRGGFNPQARAGPDAPRPPHYPIDHCFNPQARAGPDAACRQSLRDCFVSIRRPVRGLTTARDFLSFAAVFQSAGPCGA